MSMNPDFERIMKKKFGAQLKDAWVSYQEVYDRWYGLLRELALEDDIDVIRDKYKFAIEYAMKNWNSPKERFDAGSLEDFDMGL